MGSVRNLAVAKAQVSRFGNSRIQGWLPTVGRRCVDRLEAEVATDPSGEDDRGDLFLEKARGELGRLAEALGADPDRIAAGGDQGQGVRRRQADGAQASGGPRLHRHVGHLLYRPWRSVRRRQGGGVSAR